MNLWVLIGALAAGTGLIVALILYAESRGRNGEKIKRVEKDADNAKEIIRQDNIVHGNSDAAGMREKLDAALRCKRDT